MSPIDILGSLLGGKKGGGGGAGDILKDILIGGGGGKTQAPQRAPQPRSSPSSPNVSSGNEPNASDLEDMLGVGGSAPRTAPSPAPRTQPQPQPQPRSTQAPPFGGQTQQLPDDIFGQRPRASNINVSVTRPAPLSQNDQAVLMIRAMINSAKVDGEITQDEQEAILNRVGDTSQETVQFLRTEFARQLNVDEFCQSIPIGMEESIYQLSLMAIKLDSSSEADYLRSLAKGLRITPDDVNRIHQQQQAPVLYR